LQWKIKWDLSQSVLIWYGVEIENRKVVELNLADNNFEGEIANELEKLNHLSGLNLSYNKFSGSVSKSLILLDALNMTMMDENGNPFLLENNTEKETTIVTPN